VFTNLINKIESVEIFFTRTILEIKDCHIAIA